MGGDGGMSLAVCVKIFVNPNANDSGEKTHKHKQICGIVPGLGGCQQFVYLLFSGHSLWGEKHIKKVPPTIPGKSRENFVYVLLSLCVFFAPKWSSLNIHPDLPLQAKIHSAERSALWTLEIPPLLRPFKLQKRCPPKHEQDGIKLLAFKGIEQKIRHATCNMPYEPRTSWGGGSPSSWNVPTRRSICAFQWLECPFWPPSALYGGEPPHQTISSPKALKHNNRRHSRSNSAIFSTWSPSFGVISSSDGRSQLKKKRAKEITQTCPAQAPDENCRCQVLSSLSLSWFVVVRLHPCLKDVGWLLCGQSGLAKRRIRTYKVPWR